MRNIASLISCLLLALLVAVSAETAKCPPNASSQPVQGKLICLFCADGSYITQNFGGPENSCTCPGGKECEVTIDGEKATYEDYLKLTVVEG